jgi:hypothetical protein
MRFVLIALALTLAACADHPPVNPNAGPVVDLECKPGEVCR